MVHIAEGQAAIHMDFYFTLFVHEFPCVKHATLFRQALIDAFVAHQIFGFLRCFTSMQIHGSAHQRHFNWGTDLHGFHVFGD